MKKKWNTLAWISLILALAIFAFTYLLFHHLSPDGGFTAVFQEQASKPMVTLLFGVWGTMFLFAGVMSRLVGRICFKEE